MLEISVVIPTFNRIATLRKCLQALAMQTLSHSKFEVIVVDDCSSDNTAAVLAETPAVRFFLQPRNAGPAAARNVGVRAAQGKYILFLGDDTIARPTLLEQHARAHAEDEDERLAVLGYAPWSQEQPITPLMRHLFERSAFRQFAFDSILDPADAPVTCFYTCNLSISRNFLLQHGLFDEDFRWAYGEDTELAYRLEMHGLRLMFRQDFVVDHEHPTSFKTARRRAHIAGKIAVLMADKHPDRVDLGLSRTTRNLGLKGRIKRVFVTLLLDPLLDRADTRNWDQWLLMTLYDWSLRSHQWWAVLDEISRRGTAQLPPQPVPVQPQMPL